MGPFRYGLICSVSLALLGTAGCSIDASQVFDPAGGTQPNTPGVPDEQSVTYQGKGAALTVMDTASIADLGLLEAFEAAARKGKIPHQRSILPRGGTDAATMQRAGAGRRTMTLSCPTRYIHTITEMIHLDDLHACRDLLSAYLAQVK